MLHILLLAIRNLRRNKFRTVLTVLGTAVAIVTFVLLRTILSAWETASDYAAKDRLATRHRIGYVMTLPVHYIDTVRGLPGVEHATYMNWFGGRLPSKPNEYFANMAVEPASFLDVMDEIVLRDPDRQRWLEDKHSAIIGDMLASRFGLHVGDKVTLSGTIYPGDWEFTVAGIYTANRKSADRSSLWFHWSYLNDKVSEMRRDQIGWITSKVRDANRSAETAASIDTVFRTRDVQTATMSERQMNLSFLGMFSAVLDALEFISLAVLGIIALILGNTIVMGVQERTRQYGILRALGFEPIHVRVLVVSEAVGLALVGVLIGLGIAYPLVELGIGRFLEENMGAWFPYVRISPATYAMAVFLVAGLAVVASMFPAVRASRRSIPDALRHAA